MYREKVKPLLLSGSVTIKQAMQRLNESGKGILFVMNDDEELLGTVTDGDIRRGIIKGMKFNDKVELVMQRDCIVVKRGMPDLEQHVKQIMIEKMLEQIPVVDEKRRITDVIMWVDILGEKVTQDEKQLYPNRVVIMAGGKGTRLEPFTRILPKPLIPIGEKPIIELIMEKFYEHGFCNFTYTLNYKKEYIKLFLTENNMPYNIDWVEEEEFLGTAGSLSLLKEKISDTFFLTNCDSLLEVNYKEVLDWHKEHNALITIIGCHNEFKIPFGVLEVSDGRLVRILEKPVHENIINTGVYVMDPKVLQYIPEGKHMDMNELIEEVLRKEKITMYPISSGWFDIGQWDEYNKSIKYFKGIQAFEE